MFKVRIRVDEDTDIAAEVEKLANHARKHGLDEVGLFALVRNAESVLTELKRQQAETAAYGIQLALSKSLKTQDCEIFFDFSPTRKRFSGGGLLSRIFGK